MEVYKYKISPEVLKYEIRPETYDGFNFGYYSGMTEILSGGTNGTSLLTGLTIPIVLKQEYNDIGYYSAFDGNILQYGQQVNFVYSASSAQPYVYYFFVTTDSNLKYFKKTNYRVDWGDGNTQNVTVKSPDYVMHSYSQIETGYTISMTGSNTIGTFIIQKQIQVPFTGITINNPLGTIYFTNFNGSWSNTPESINTFFTGDSYNYLPTVLTPYTISGFCESLYDEFLQYGVQKYPGISKTVNILNGVTGVTTSINPLYTAYTINNVQYIDYSGGTTMFFATSYGLTNDDVIMSAITKDEVLMNVIDQPEVQVSGKIERGKNSGLESFVRIGEVDSVGDVVRYGYGYFNVVNLES
jgi:hypothetical protein